jgi:hypothetical protein
MLVLLYNGNVHLWNNKSQQLVKSFEVQPVLPCAQPATPRQVCDLPVRAAVFVPAACRFRHSRHVEFYPIPHQIRVFKYNTLERLHAQYQTAVMRRDFDTADKVLPKFPKKQRTRVSHFLEKQGFRKQALAVGSDPEHRFD